MIRAQAMCASVAFDPAAISGSEQVWESAGWAARSSATPRLAYVDVDAVIAICRSIEKDPVSRRSIAERARDVGLTSTRLTHYFRRYVGMSPHQYVMRWRLTVSAELLDSGLGVSESCYRSGFENLSHFCRTFRRTFGTRASAWQTLALRERRRKVQDLANPLV
jgi:AraC-like DNA-binding protein